VSLYDIEEVWISLSERDFGYVGDVVSVALQVGCVGQFTIKYGDERTFSVTKLYLRSWTPVNGY